MSGLAGMLLFAVLCAQPGSEAPMLREQVLAGQLPPVAQRLPDEPPVVEPVDTIGRYGGTWRRLASAPGDMGLNSRLGYEPLLRWDRTGRHVLPGVAESWSMNDDASVFTFHLRRGMKWSDGAPLTSDDFLFHYEHIDRHPELASMHARWKTLDGRLYELTCPDPYTVVIRFDGSYGLFPKMLAYCGSQRALFSPRHYLEPFHADFADRAQLDAAARDAGFVDWAARFIDRTDLETNPDLPTVNPFVCTVPFPSARCLAVRNPYYWKIDPQGRQLPYIDQIAYTTVFDLNVLNMRALDGEVDFQARHIDGSNYVLFMESRRASSNRANHYRVQMKPGSAAKAIYLNQHSRDDRLRPLLQDRRFRIALSLAVDRQEINELCFMGVSAPSNAVTTPYDPFYVEGLDTLHTQHDPRRSEALLDEVGLHRDGNGMRRWPNGEPFREILHVLPEETGDAADVWQLVVEYWREVGLTFVVRQEDRTLGAMNVRNGNCNFWGYGSGGVHWDLDGNGRAPIAEYSYYAPLYGRYFATDGAAGVKPPPAHQQLIDWYLEMKATPSAQRRLALGQMILREWAEQCYMIGICRRLEVFIISDRFRNVPDDIISDYRLMSPGYLGIEQFWIDGEVDARTP